MILTNTPFNGSNFHGWSRNIKMALGAKLKLGFIDGSCVKPTSDHDDLQRWIGCDYMVTCWILNSMVTELLDAFLYAQSTCELWKEIRERYGQIREFSFCYGSSPTVNKAYYIVQQIKKQKQVTNHVFEPTAFFANMNNKNNSNGKRGNNKGNRNEVKGETKNEISFKKVCTNCGQEGHLFERCFERLGYPDWYKGKKAKKKNGLVAHVNSGFDEHFSEESPYDTGYENEVGLGQNGHVDQKLVAAVC
ncbi:retrovirus-related pol polyprotein from transposon TNT 1-94 [Tanacetum coccineum]